MVVTSLPGEHIAPAPLVCELQHALLLGSRNDERRVGIEALVKTWIRPGDWPARALQKRCTTSHAVA
jgi:hypothetical protein